MPAAIVAAGIVLCGASLYAGVVVTVRNELPFARASETIEVSMQGDLDRLHVFEGGREILAQSLDLDGDGRPESLIFQADMPANGERSFELREGEKRVYRKEDFRVYGRFVRERFDDFAWENDRTAHRMYGAALETWQKEPLTSSTVDVWLKRTRRLVINDWYMVDDYHRDHGEGADFYSAGKSRGCGGSGLWRDGRLVVSKNFRDSKVLANGPIRLVFELRYPGFETKRITLDAGQNLSKFESRYESVIPVQGERDDNQAVVYATGIRKTANDHVRIERGEGWMRTWEAVTNGEGEFGCAVVMANPSAISDVVDAEGNHLFVVRGDRSQATGPPIPVTSNLSPVTYYAGAGWNRSGDFAGVDDWDRYVAQWSQRIKSPLRVTIK